MAQIQITDYEKWGNLLKAWVKEQIPLPKTPQELKDQMAQAGVDGVVPDDIKSLQFIVPGDKSLVILLPQRRAVEEAEARLSSGGAYPLPDFYKKAFGGVDAKPADWKKFNAERLGEYTINTCQ